MRTSECFMETTEGKVLWKLILMLLWEHSSFVLVNYPILWRPLEPLVCWRILETVLKSSYHIYVYPPSLFGSMSAIKHILNKTEVNKDFKYECIYLENFPIISCYHSWSCFPPKAAEDKPSVLQWCKALRIWTWAFLVCDDTDSISWTNSALSDGMASPHPSIHPSTSPEGLSLHSMSFKEAVTLFCTCQVWLRLYVERLVLPWQPRRRFRHFR